MGVLFYPFRILQGVRPFSIQHSVLFYILPSQDSTEVVKNFCMFLLQGLVFKTFETLASFNPDLLTSLIPACKQAVVQLEQKRGVGTDMQLR